MAKIGVPLGVHITAQNLTARTEKLTLTVGRSDDFSYAGLSKTEDAVSQAILPYTRKHALPPVYTCTTQTNLVL